MLKINSLKASLGLTGNQVGLLQRLALHKFRKDDIETYAESINKSREIARQELKRLVELGLLEEIKEGKKFVYKIKIDALSEKLEAI